MGGKELHSNLRARMCVCVCVKLSRMRTISFFSFDASSSRRVLLSVWEEITGEYLSQGGGGGG